MSMNQTIKIDKIEKAPLKDYPMDTNTKDGATARLKEDNVKVSSQGRSSVAKAPFKEMISIKIEKAPLKDHSPPRESKMFKSSN